MELSIIVPVFNSEHYLEQCIRSIVTEMNNNVELLIIDDGSVDESYKIYEKYRSTNVKIYKNTNHGVSYARNFGLNKALGKYVMFVDSDDYLSNGWYQVIEQAMMTNNDVIYILSNQLQYTYESKLLEYVFQIDKECNLSTPWSKLFKKNYLKEKGIHFKESVIIGEDMLFNAEVILNTSKISYIKTSIYNYRINPQSVTKVFNDKVFYSDQFFLKELKKLVNIRDVSYQKYYNYCLENAIIIFIQKLQLIGKTERKKFYYIFKEEPYKSYIRNNKCYKNIFNRIIFICIKNSRYDLAGLIIKLKNIARNVIKKQNKKEYIIKI